MSRAGRRSRRLTIPDNRRRRLLSFDTQIEALINFSVWGCRIVYGRANHHLALRCKGVEIRQAGIAHPTLG